jgi:hypothetical protein
MRGRRLAVIAGLAMGVLLTACQAEGHLDNVTAGEGVIRVQGWARDPDTDAPIAVHVWSNGALRGTGTADGSRPDVAAATATSARPAGANHGFDVTVPVAPGTHDVCVYGIDRAGGDDNALIGCSRVAVTGPVGVRCVVTLHGHGGTAQATQSIFGIRYVYPGGNASAAGGGQRWLYFGEDQYAAARATVAQAIDANGCSRVVIDGFSNGAAFAAKLYCRGDTFDGRVAGYVVDDPVTDRATAACARATGSNVAMYWTGGLDYAPAGFDCPNNGWTCEGGSLIGRDAYAATLGVPLQRSVHTNHEPYLWPPEVGRWLS